MPTYARRQLPHRRLRDPRVRSPWESGRPTRRWCARRPQCAYEGSARTHTHAHPYQVSETAVIFHSDPPQLTTHYPRFSLIHYNPSLRVPSAQENLLPSFSRCRTDAQLCLVNISDQSWIKMSRQVAFIFNLFSFFKLIDASILRENFL